MPDDLTVYIVDDEPGVVDSLTALLTAEGYRVEGFTSASAFLARCERPVRGCLVADVRMPDMSGLELQERLIALHVQLPQVMISASADVPMCVQALRSGAIHFLEKPFRPLELIAAIKEAFKIATSAEHTNPSAGFLEALRHLTGSEYAVLTRMVAGQTNARIAQELDISLRTMQFRRAQLLRKLGVASKEELMALVFRSGWSPLAEPPSR